MHSDCNCSSDRRLLTTAPHVAFFRDTFVFLKFWLKIRSGISKTESVRKMLLLDLCESLLITHSTFDGGMLLKC